MTTTLPINNQFFYFLQKYYSQFLVTVISISWCLYPWAFSWIFPVSTRLLVAGSFLILGFWTYFAKPPIYKYEWNKHK